MTLHIGRAHVQPKTAQYELKYSSNQESTVRVTVTGLERDVQRGVYCDDPLPDMSGTDPLTACVLYG